MANPKTVARLEKRIRERIAYALQFELADPRASFVTVTQVDLSPDLSQAKVYYSVLGDAGDKSKTEHMLDHATGFIRKQLGRVLETRTIPRLSWSFDPSIEEAARLSKLIEDARKKDAEIRGDDAPADSSPDAGPDVAND